MPIRLFSYGRIMLVALSVGMMSSLQAQDAAVIYGETLSEEELTGLVDELAAGLPHDTVRDAEREFDLRAQAILSWADSRISGNVRLRFPVSESEAEEKLDELFDYGIIPQLSEEMAEFNRNLLQIAELIADNDDLEEEAIESFYLALRDSAPDDYPITDDWWKLQLDAIRTGRFCRPCHPTTTDEYRKINRETVIALLTRTAAARELIDQFALLESEKLLEQARDALVETTVELGVQEALLKMLREREWDRWRLVAYRDHLAVSDSNDQEAIGEIISVWERKVTSLQNYNYVLDLPF